MDRQPNFLNSTNRVGLSCHIDIALGCFDKFQVSVICARYRKVFRISTIVQMISFGFILPELFNILSLVNTIYSKSTMEKFIAND